MGNRAVYTKAINYTLLNVKKPVCVFIRCTHKGVKFFTEAAALVPSNTPKDGMGFVLTEQNEIEVENEIQLKTVQNKTVTKKCTKISKIMQPTCTVSRMKGLW